MKKILLIDDSPLAIAIGKDIIKDLGYECITALNGKEGIDIFKKENPCCTLIDLIMPKMDGFEVIDEIRKINPNAKIVILSSFLNEENIRKLDSLNIKDNLSKPINAHKLNLILSGTTEEIH